MRSSRSDRYYCMIRRKKLSQQQTSFERFCSFDALYDSSYRVCRNVRWKDSTINFEENRIETILQTEADLRACEYKQLVFSCFSIIERGKPRDIRACHINDRLVQNALCEQSLLPELTPKFIYDNCATLKNRGIDFALTRAKKHLYFSTSRKVKSFEKIIEQEPSLIFTDILDCTEVCDEQFFSKYAENF